MSIHLKEYTPSVPLMPYVELYAEGYYNADSSGRLSTQIIPNSCLELIIHLNDLHCDLFTDHQWAQSPDYMMVGLFTESCEIQFQSTVKVFSIRLKPEALYTLFKIPAAAFKNSFHDMSLVLGRGFHAFASKLKEEKSIAAMIRCAEDYLLKKLYLSNKDKGYINTAAELIRSTKGSTIQDIAQRVCISQRQLEREFKEKVGVSPKHYLRITRINEVLLLINNREEIDLTSIAYECGYFDQAHFINDFKKITGQKPGDFIKVDRWKHVVSAHSTIPSQQKYRNPKL